MKISFFGSSLVSAYWNGAATYYRGILRSLAGRGHTITFYEPDAYDRQHHRDIPDPPWARVVVYSPDELERCLGEASDSDLIVKASGVGVADHLLESAIVSIRRPGSLAAFWDVDAPATSSLCTILCSPTAGAIRWCVPIKPWVRVNVFRSTTPSIL
jgi:spore maturation protein CgeB